MGGRHPAYLQHAQQGVARVVYSLCPHVVGSSFGYIPSARVWLVHSYGRWRREEVIPTSPIRGGVRGTFVAIGGC
eukprot:1192960-Prorocentrum_minimum.AAC.1